ncbi:MAG: SCO6880 family protein, partial [Acidimicrobiales bacterium]
SPAARSYRSLLSAAGAETCRHEALLALQLRVTGATARAVRMLGGGDRGACALLAREVQAMRQQLGSADIPVERVLDERALATACRRALRDGAGRCPPCGVAWPWPLVVEEEWGSLRTDGVWHATYWIAEWPRVDVGPEFLAPLLLGSARRTVAVVMEPLSPARAVRQAERTRTADIADAELRRRGGFLATARRSREAELAGRREQELADGHASFRFSGYVTVTARTSSDLDALCDATEQAASQCRLELRRLYGDQARAFSCTLPLGRGLS